MAALTGVFAACALLFALAVVRRRRQSRGLSAVWLAAAAVLFFGAMLHMAGIRFDQTGSAPGIYRIGTPSLPPKVGDMVCVDAAHVAAPELLRARVPAGVLVLKRVVAGSGARVDQTPDGALRVDGRALRCSRPREVDGQGGALPRLAFPVVVPEGHIWLASDHPRGLDSRYMGAVAAEAVVCLAQPLWTWLPEADGC